VGGDRVDRPEVLVGPRVPRLVVEQHGRRVQHEDEGDDVQPEDAAVEHRPADREGEPRQQEPDRREVGRWKRLDEPHAGDAPEVRPGDALQPERDRRGEHDGVAEDRAGDGYPPRHGADAQQPGQRGCEAGHTDTASASSTSRSCGHASAPGA
jgi:hypothetical protein